MVSGRDGALLGVLWRGVAIFSCFVTKHPDKGIRRVQPAKSISAKPEDLNSIPRIHVVGGETLFLGVVLSCLPSPP